MKKIFLFISKSPKKIWKKFKSLSKKKKALVLFVLLIVASIVGFNIYASQKMPNYKMEAATLGPVTETVSETGNVTTAGLAPIYSTTTGTVDQVFVNNGSYVKKGEKLFSVVSTATKQEKETALSSYLTAKATLESAKATQLSLQANMFSAWDSFKELAESDDYETGDGVPKYAERGVAEFHISEKEWLSAEAAYKNQQKFIAQAQAQTSATWQAYQATQDSTVVSTIEGVVENLAVSTGSLITAQTFSAATVTEPALLVMNSEIKPVVKISVGETDIAKVKEGQTATIEFDAFKRTFFNGKVDRVDSVASPSQGVVSYNVYVTLDEMNQNLKTGMTADVDIVVSQKEDVLTVPSSSVKPYQGGRAVRVLNGKEIEYIPVEIGAKGDGRTEIISGIEEGTMVIVALENDQLERKNSLF